MHPPDARLGLPPMLAAFALMQNLATQLTSSYHHGH